MEAVISANPPPKPFLSPGPFRTLLSEKGAVSFLLCDRRMTALSVMIIRRDAVRFNNFRLEIYRFRGLKWKVKIGKIPSR